jgi:hypothetical protein
VNMKRVLVVVLVLLLGFSASSAFAARSGFAIGAEFTFTNWFGGYGGMLTFHLPKFPVIFGLGGFFGNNAANLVLTADWWLTNGHLVGILDYYIGLGLYTNILFADPAFFALGARLPLGLQIWPLGNGLLELFIEIAPAWIPITSTGIVVASFDLQGGLGFRIWF